VDLGDAAMLGVAQGAHQRYDIQTELALGKREGAFLLRAVREEVKFARWGYAAADHEPQTHQPTERGDGAGAVVGDPRALPA